MSAPVRRGSARFANRALSQGPDYRFGGSPIQAANRSADEPSRSSGAQKSNPGSSRTEPKESPALRQLLNELRIALGLIGDHE